MKHIKRWTTGIIASFDSVISQIENHEALVNSAISEMQQAGSRAKVQLKRVQKDGCAMRERLVELGHVQQLWKDRARKAAKLDQDRALECLRRLKRVESEASSLEVQEREHARLEKQLQADLQQVEQRLQKLKQQRNIMRTRQSRAEAMCAAENTNSTLISEIDEIFDRWDYKVTDYEMRGSVLDDSHDELEEEFLTQEEELELQERLDSLLQDKQ